MRSIKKTLPDNNRNQTICHADPGFALGRHMTIEYYDCAPEILLDKQSVESIMLGAARKSGATIISSSFHQFDPQGVSGVVIIAESHFTVHAWPEHNYAAVDIFTCTDRIDLDTAIHAIKAQFLSRRFLISSDQNRGVLHPMSARCVSPRRDEKRIHKQIRPISWENVYDRTNPWGVSTSVDLYDCNAEMIQAPGCINALVCRLYEKLGISGEPETGRAAPVIYHGGHSQATAGFSITRSIDTSVISGHFAHAAHAAYLDIFSCKRYEPRALAEFSLSYLGGSHYKMQVALRR